LVHFGVVDYWFYLSERITAMAEAFDLTRIMSASIESSIKQRDPAYQVGIQTVQAGNAEIIVGAVQAWENLINAQRKQIRKLYERKPNGWKNEVLHRKELIEFYQKKIRQY
jgi:PIN domain nuclease of toxin-antitoxin system